MQVYLLVLLLFMGAQDALGCHFHRHRREIKEDVNNTEIVEKTKVLRNFMSWCLETKVGVSNDIKSWDSVLDFSVLDSKWFQETERYNCSDGDNDNRDCWQEALFSFVNSSSYILRPAIRCINEYQELSVSVHDCTVKGWTPFFSNGNAENNGDSELLAEHLENFPGQMCKKPNAINVRRVSDGRDYKETREIVEINPRLGFLCKNNLQNDSRCDDYKVRYCCPYEPVVWGYADDWTQYFDMDQPSGSGDYEFLASARRRDPSVCQYPSAVEVAVKGSDDDYRSAKQNVSLNLEFGFVCRNEDQKDGRMCLNYKIRFRCPKLRDQNSQWFAKNASNARSIHSRVARQVTTTSYVRYSNCVTRTVTLQPDRSKLNMGTVVKLVRGHLSYGNQNDVWQVRLQEMVRDDSPVVTAVQTCNKEVYNITTNPTSGWSNWSPWDNCPARCGEYGEQLRRRQCINGVPGLAPCEGSIHERRRCQPPQCWSKWSPCTKTCGHDAVRTRRLECTNPNDTSITCTQPSNETQNCHLGPCDGWSQWTPWSQCHSQCGQEVDQRRSRYCTTGAPGSSKCPGPDQETQACEVLNPVCGDWGEWSSCTTTCGDGKRARNRQCNNSPCHAPTSQEEGCPNQPACPTTATGPEEGGRWSPWSSWEYCHANCGQTSTQSRRRYCMTGGHPPCIGPYSESQECTKKCGHWTNWTEFTVCSCETSKKSRSRECIGAEPRTNGCWGDPAQTQDCWAGHNC